jgi:hypothetical protein
MTEEIYTQIVTDLMESKSNEVISNGEPSHAQVLFEAFFQYAKTEVLIFCHKLDARVFSAKSLVAKAKDAFERGVNIHVIIQSSNPDESPFLKFLRDESATSSRVSILLCPSDSHFCDQKVNYAVMDARAYRFEEDRSEIKAIASMNQLETAGALTRVFNGTRSILCT